MRHGNEVKCVSAVSDTNPFRQPLLAWAGLLTFSLHRFCKAMGDPGDERPSRDPVRPF